MLNSPFIIPVVAMLIPIVAIIGGAITQMHKSRLVADQRMAMLARGVPLAEIEATLKSSSFANSIQTAKDPMRSLGNARRAAVVLISVGVGLMLFGLLLERIVQVREVLAVAVSGLIPLAIGLGFVVDYKLQQRELSRFGLEVGANSR